MRKPIVLFFVWNGWIKADIHAYCQKNLSDHAESVLFDFDESFLVVEDDEHVLFDAGVVDGDEGLPVVRAEVLERLQEEAGPFVVERLLSANLLEGAQEDFVFEETLRDIHVELIGLNDEATILANTIAHNFEELGI